MTRKMTIAAVVTAALFSGLAVTDGLARGGGGHGGGGHGGGHFGGHGGGHFGGHAGGFGGGRGMHGFHGIARASIHVRQGGHLAAHHALHNNLASHSGFAGHHQLGSDRRSINRNSLASRNVGRNSHDTFARTRNAFGNERGWQRWRNSYWAHAGDRRGGFGWYGPVFWPYGYGDAFSYVFSPYDYDPFWDYDFDGLLASLIYGSSYDPYGSYADAAYGAGGDDIYDGGYSVDSSAHDRRRHVAPAAPSATQIAETCSGLAPGVTDLPATIDKAVQPTQSERPAFADLHAASAKAAAVVKASCPSTVPLTPVSRLDAVQTRIEALVQAVQILRSPLDQLYAGLSDEQKQRIDGSGNKAGQAASGQSGGLPQICNGNAGGYAQLPMQRIEQVVQPTTQQRSALDALKDASAKAADELKSSCPTTVPATAPARLDAVEARLEAMDQAVKAIRPALDTFYTSLTDEQKARFDVMEQSQSGGGQPDPDHS